MYLYKVLQIVCGTVSNMIKNGLWKCVKVKNCVKVLRIVWMCVKVLSIVCFGVKELWARQLCNAPRTPTFSRTGFSSLPHLAAADRDDDNGHSVNRVIEIFSHCVALIKTVDAIARLTTFPNGAADNRNNGNN